MIDRLMRMKESLIGCIEQEIHNIDGADTKELGEAIDMIKDLEEAIYYCTITKAMNAKEEPEPRHYYSPMYYDPYRDMDRGTGKMYYNGDGHNGGNHTSSSSTGTRSYTEREYTMPLDMRDQREGRSSMSRKGYMEGKETRQPKEKQMKELEKYMQELTQDIVEMIQGSSSEEKQLLQKKISALAERINQVNV